MDSQYQPSPEAERDGPLQMLERLAWLGRTDVPNEDVRSAWTHLEQLLAERVGGRLSAGISQAEFDEFNGLNEDAGTRWLRLHVPDYQAIVRAEIATLTRQAAAWFTSHFPANSDPEEHRDVEAA